MPVLGPGHALDVCLNRLLTRHADLRTVPDRSAGHRGLLKAAVREAQRTAAELRMELDAQRKELAEAQVAICSCRAC